MYKSKELEALRARIEQYAARHQVSVDRTLVLLHHEVLVPVGVFRNLSPLEAVVVYTHDHHNLSFTAIAKKLEKQIPAVWTAYQNGKRRFRSPRASPYSIPMTKLRSRTRSILELGVFYLHDEMNLRFFDIAHLMNRDERTIWTAYDRARRKR